MNKFPSRLSPFLESPYIFVGLAAALLFFLGSISHFVYPPCGEQDLGLLLGLTIWPECNTIKTLLAGGGISFLASYVTASIIDGTFQVRQSELSKEADTNALENLAEPLNTHLRLLRDAYIAATPADQVPDEITLREALCNDYYRIFKNFDISAQSPDYQFEEGNNWSEWFVYSLAGFRKSMDSVLQVYGNSISDELSVSLISLSQSKFIKYISYERNQQSPHLKIDFYGRSWKETIEEHVSRLIDVCDKYSDPRLENETRLLEEEIDFTSPLAPEPGSAVVDRTN